MHFSKFFIESAQNYVIWTHWFERELMYWFVTISDAICCGRSADPPFFQGDDREPANAANYRSIMFHTKQNRRAVEAAKFRRFCSQIHWKWKKNSRCVRCCFFLVRALSPSSNVALLTPILPLFWKSKCPVCSMVLLGNTSKSVVKTLKGFFSGREFWFSGSVPVAVWNQVNQFHPVRT